MGGGEWINERQEQQQMQVQQAYKEVRKIPQHINTSEIKIDGIDQAYVWARTFTPSWMMLLIFFVGLITVIPILLRKFGINLKINFEKSSKGK
jgi:ABC-type uncharacterized transport system fused permease/ATPase subunit